jgi:hypothetical protein
MPQIEVTFDIDANGIVHVTAKDKATNKEQSIRIQANGGLSDADIDAMVKEAESNKAEDEKRKAAVEAKNQADAVIHSTEKAMAEHGDKVGEDERNAITTALEDLKGVVEGGDAEVDEAGRGDVCGPAELGRPRLRRRRRAGGRRGRRGRCGVRGSRRRRPQEVGVTTRLMATFSPRCEEVVIGDVAAASARPGTPARSAQALQSGGGFPTFPNSHSSNV